MPNAPQAVIMFYAVNKIGAIANMVHPLSSEKEIEFCLKESSSVVCLTLDQFYGKFENIRENVHLRNLILTSVKDVLSPIKRKGYYLVEGRKIKKVPANAEIIWWEKFLLDGKNYHVPFHVVRKAEDPAVIPVSYTHLDVYKRQDQRRWLGSMESDHLIRRIIVFLLQI